MRLIGLRRHFNSITFFLAILSCLYELYGIRIHILQNNDRFIYEGANGIVLPRRLILVILLALIGYLYSTRKDDNMLFFLQMKSRKVIWNNRVMKLFVLSFLNSALVILSIIIMGLSAECQPDRLYLLIPFWLNIGFQFAGSFLLLELIKWVTNNYAYGMLLITAIGISDGYTSFISIFFRRFSLLENIIPYDGMETLIKLVDLIVICFVLYAFGYFYSKRKEFYETKSGF